MLRDDGGLAAQVREVAPKGVRVVADVVGGPGMTELLPVLSEDGRCVVAGAIAGPWCSSTCDGCTWRA